MAGEDEMDLPRTPDSPSIAREILADVLDGQAYEKAELAVSELVTNALRHTDGAIALRYLPREGYVRVEVMDESGTPPRLRQPDPGDIGGRGLVIVDEVSDRWGSGPRPDGRSGKAVWFEVDSSKSAPA